MNRRRFDHGGFAFRERVADDPDSPVEFVHGDDKVGGLFLPQTKLERWSNEVNVSLRLIDEDFGAGALAERGGKVEWRRGGRTARLYDLGAERFEFDVVLEERPASPVLLFTLQHKGVEFHRQDALTAAEIAEDCERAEDVVGSYAIYAAGRRGHRKGGQNYRSGKVGHIFRPFAEDTRGRRWWCDLTLDAAAGLVSIAVPPEALDAVDWAGGETLTVDPTIGYSTAGASSVAIARSSGNLSSRRGTSYTMPEAGTADSMSAWLTLTADFDETIDLTCAINEQDSDSPGSHGLVASASASINLPDNSNYTRSVTLAGESLTSGATYLLNAFADGGDLANTVDANLRYDSTAHSGNYYQENFATFAAAAEDPWTDGSSGTGREYSVWLTYTAAGITQSIGLASETDTAQAMGAAKALAIGLASETDAALGLTAAKSAPIGLAAEADSALALAAAKAKEIGLASETDTALPVGSGTAMPIGLASETDTALALTAAKALAIGLAAETDAALALTAAKAARIGMALEADSARPLTAAKARAIGIAAELDAAFPLGRAKAKAIGLASETDTALALVIASTTLTRPLTADVTDLARAATITDLARTATIAATR